MGLNDARAVVQTPSGRFLRLQPNRPVEGHSFWRQLQPFGTASRHLCRLVLKMALRAGNRAKFARRIDADCAPKGQT